jgi:large subunit ribosomal protein L5e
MPFIKVVKNKAYYMRYQVKYRRRRQGITDYYQRRKLVVQDKNKYNARKYRFVARVTNRHVICQVVYSTIKGDHILESAYSYELPAFGIKAGLTNYAACYATGLLCARRTLTKLGLADTYKGNEDEIDGSYFCEEEQEEGPRPFRAYLDLGLARSSTGANVFGCMKGAVDGGIAIPHGENRFPGFDAESKELDVETHKKYIFGGHVSEYMEELKEEDKSMYDKQFSVYIKNGINADSMEDMYTSAHSKIRADPARKAGDKKEHKTVVKGRRSRLSRQQRQDRVKQKIASFHFAQDNAE